MSSPKLPIESIRATFHSALQKNNRFVLEAPTGSGKSTQVPQFLIDNGIVSDGYIAMLQPRRIAARMLAKRIAWERKSPLGDEIGYQIRFENRSSAKTKLLMLTEGILLRKMFTDPLLTGIKAILFDEFHERNLFSDLSLAKAKQIQSTSRPDLIIGVMSATLNGDQLENYLQPCSRINCKGRTYPVEIDHTTCKKQNRDIPVWEKAAIEFSKVAQNKIPGHILIFMPGAFEINQTIRQIDALPQSKDYQLLTLHGELSPDLQDKAVEDCSTPKVIVSTNVAETSLTIPGVKVVIDSGQARVPCYDPQRGVNTLLVQPISQASAAQRTGRAGRDGPGHCIRLWGKNEHHHRPLFEKPEIARIDLSETLLMLSASHAFNSKTFPWFEKPENSRVEHALTLLQDLGAMDSEETITDLGKKMAAFPLHPRYSRLFIEASRKSCLHLATEIAALSQDRSILLHTTNKTITQKRLDLFLNHESKASDVLLELNAYHYAKEKNFNLEMCRALSIHAGAARNIQRIARQFLDIAKKQDLQPEPAEWSDWKSLRQCLLMAFSDQIAKRLDKGTLRCDLVHKRRGTRRRDSCVDTEWFISTEIEERNIKGSVQVMLGKNSAIQPEWIDDIFPNEIHSETKVEWDPWQKKVIKTSRRSFRDISLEEKDHREVSKDEAAMIIAEQIKEGNLKLKNWNHKAETLIERINFVSQHFPEYEIAPITKEDRMILLEQICYGAKTEKELNQLEVIPAIMDWLTQEQIPMLETCAPESIKTENKGRCKLRYENGQATLSARIQQLFDQDLILIENRVPVRYEILAPNHRPVQITDDLAGFWESSYPAIKKELRGRYPKHEWR